MRSQCPVLAEKNQYTSKETHEMSKETHEMSKETHGMSKRPSTLDEISVSSACGKYSIHVKRDP